MTPRDTTVRSSMTVPPDLAMGLLGSADENLRTLEAALSADVHVRGNTVSFAGESADVALAERVVSELIAIVAGGQSLSPELVRRSVAMIAGEDNTSPAEVLTRSITSTPSTPTPSSSASARPAPERPIWRWPRRSRPCRPNRSPGSS